MKEKNPKKYLSSVEEKLFLRLMEKKSLRYNQGKYLDMKMHLQNRESELFQQAHKGIHYARYLELI